MAQQLRDRRMRRFLPLCLAVLIPAMTSAQERAIDAERLDEGVWLLRSGPGGNILVIDREEGIILIDAQSASATGQVAEAIARISLRPVRMVFSSHYHEDHVAGNVRFRATGARIFGHANLARRAGVDTVIDELEWHREAADPLAFPQVNIATDTVVALDDVSLDVLAFDDAHTDGDLAFMFSSFNVLHTGDIVEVEAYPFIDWWGGGSLDGTIRAVSRLIALADLNTRVVPGHGHVVDREYLIEYRRMLETVRTRVTDAIDRGSSLEQVMDAGYTEEFDAARGGRAAGRQFVGILYLGLSRQ